MKKEAKWEEQSRWNEGQVVGGVSPQCSRFDRSSAERTLRRLEERELKKLFQNNNSFSDVGEICSGYTGQVDHR